ncbi:hypothetical protein HPB52_002863 [Rhipicephalus sanguineus]|uniref:Pseudouridine synthase n=1 Tax=Rhipicephalus sanguineus TaxID=34632 RepID=A0A9D4T794_RHISA|nr:hypothetical protein HPB52_002863 [Rhipicephalus sanguineus]
MEEIQLQLAPGIQITGLNPSTQTVQIDATFLQHLQQLQQQGNINISITPSGDSSGVDVEQQLDAASFLIQQDGSGGSSVVLDQSLPLVASEGKNGAVTFTVMEDDPTGPNQEPASQVATAELGLDELAAAEGSLMENAVMDTADLVAPAVITEAAVEKYKKTVDDGDGARIHIRQGQKELRPGFGSDRFDETEYYFQHGLRKVYPYYFTYTTFCKGRWVGHLLVDVFTREFRAHSREVYENAIKAGLVTVNNKPVGTDYRLKDNDLLANTLHRHEVPVLGAPIKILHDADDMVVIDKPPSIPVHPCGRYRHNSVIFILAKEHGLQNLHTVHRLDRLTSGLLLMSRSVDRARELENEIKGRLVSKEYLCRVEGCFPDETVICCEPIEVISHKIGVCGVGAHGKECKTEFKKLSYNGKSSVVLCKPHTGRMHQIRVHLQFLGK